MRYYTAKKLIWVMVFAYGICALHGQNALVPDILPSADAKVFGKFGAFGASHYSGQLGTQIPLEGIDANGKNITLSLNYEGSGITVNQHAGWVGQNWSLPAEGIITRTVRGEADELGAVMGSQYINYWFSFFATVTSGTLLTESKTNNIDSLKSLADIVYGTAQTGKILNTEPDIFSFNAMGKTGKFFLGPDGNWKIISDYNFKVVFDYNDANNFITPLVDDMPLVPTKKYQRTMKGFELIDDEGYRYYFGMDGTAIDYSMPFFRQSNYYKSETNWVATSWHLTSVKDPAGNTIFTLEYERKYFTADIDENFSSRKEECSDSNGNWVGLKQNYSHSVNGSLMCPVYLKKISNNKNQEIRFKISDATEKSMPWTLLCSKANELLPFIHQFPYLTEPGSYSYDFVAARFNFPMNNPLKGLKWQKLDSVLYYSNNILTSGYKLNFNNNANERLFLLGIDKINQTVSGVENFYTMTYHMKEKAPEYISSKIDHFGYYDGTTWYSPDAGNYTNYTLLEQNIYPSREPNVDSCYLGMMTALKFPTGGRAEFYYELHDYSGVLSDNKQSIISESGVMSGLRIKEVKYFDPTDALPKSSKRYFYKKNFGSGGTISSGCLSMKPDYVFINWLYATNFYPAGGARVSQASSNVVRPSVNLFESPVSYSEVTEMNPDGSYTVYKYSSHEDIKDQLPTATLYLGLSPFFQTSDKS